MVVAAMLSSMGSAAGVHNDVVTGTDINNLKMICDPNCCTSSNNVTICFINYNFTDRVNITKLASWDLGVRWTYAILVMLVAFLGNLSVIIILLKNRLLLRTSVNHFILNMSVADLLLALAGPIPFTIRDTSYFWVLGEVWCHLEGYILMLVMMASVTSLAIISFDRMVGVVSPFHQHLKRRHAVAIIASVWLLAGLLALPFGFYRVYSERVWKDLTERICGEEDDKIRIWWKVSILGLNWFPLGVMVISYTTIFFYFKQVKFKGTISRREHPAMVHLKQRVVRMMFAMVLVFTVCWLPFQILKLAQRSFIDDTGHYVSTSAEKTYKTLLTVSQYMIYCNPALNPIVYALMHQTFRRAFRVTFPCFYNRKSSLVLTPGVGIQRYVWSVKSTVSDVYGKDVVTTPPRNLRDRIRGRNQLTPSAVLSTSALAASIALDSKSTQQRERSSSERRGDGALSRTVAGPPELSFNASEGYVNDLQHRRMSFISTGALGHLITQVIEEETSSDLENERVL
ncbi:neuropeptide Y receptor type 2 isoform X1 [Procambarus clarkii]|uniref:neuropeptide Y receptor type 2 isoform X1 n=2 Tax=Procambarus clarkii TaxID=6728 RepID=UPI0037437842